MVHAQCVQWTTQSWNVTAVSRTGASVVAQAVTALAFSVVSAEIGTGANHERISNQMLVRCHTRHRQ